MKKPSQFRHHTRGRWTTIGVSAAGLLLALTSAQALAVAVDSDSDGVDDNLDNCISVPNGTNTFPAGDPRIQCDTDGDGIGNICDADLDSSGGVVNFADLAAFKAAFGTTDPDADLNCSGGVVNFADLATFKQLFGAAPGPSCTDLFYGCVADLDPLTIPKYVTPLVIPPVMNNNGAIESYDIAVREFKQQILPGGIWNTINGRTDAFPATTVWSYGPDTDVLPDSTALGGGVGIAPAPNSQFNYPAYTFETVNAGRAPDGTYLSGSATSVTWVNDLKENFGAGPNFLSHLLPIDQTLHWANPKADCIAGAPRTDCRGQSPDYYQGPVPIITHVHGGHTEPQSDGYPEGWYLPATDPNDPDFVCTNSPSAAISNANAYVCKGTLVNNLGGTTNPTTFGEGFANFVYEHDQPSTTLWYHDHSLGMTRSNVYAGPAGFFLVRQPTGGEDGLVSGVLPTPAPVRGEDLATTNLPASLGGSREKYREIPIVVQDRSFNSDGGLFYPADRAFFEGLGDGFGNIDGQYNGNAAAGLNIDFVPQPTSDIAPIWNPEAFFNTMVVNGVTWPTQEVAPALYRFRLLNGCNSRFLNLALVTNPDDPANPTTGTFVDRTVWDDTTSPPTSSTVSINELSFFQIGTEQSLLPQVVQVETGFATRLPCVPDPVTGLLCPTPAPDTQQALLMGLAERADVIVDFRGLPDGTVVRLTNTAPDAPFGGFPDVPADSATTGQVMEFVVNNLLLGTSDSDELREDDGTLRSGNDSTRATPPQDLVLGPADNALPATQIVRRLALLEEESALVCVNIDGVTGEITQIPGEVPPCVTAEAEAFAPLAAVLGTVDQSGTPSVQLWSDPVSTNPDLDATETWELQNFSEDAHPIHLHLVKFNVNGREGLEGGPSVGGNPLYGGNQAWENGWKDTVIAYPGESTSVTSTFDIPGLYVWHCHIVEHEDNEMMVPYCVGDPANCGGLDVQSGLQSVFTEGLSN
jgi:FtsP/CotA-like multicopper oxidase with cupredoxin domain